MSKEVMSLEKFKHLISVIRETHKKQEVFSDALQNTLCSDSFCFVSLADRVITALTNMIADDFNCWYELPSFKNDESLSLGDFPFFSNIEREDNWWEGKFCKKENEIDYWLYDLDKIEEEKEGKEAHITVNKEDVDVSTVESFYNYLVKFYS